MLFPRIYEYFLRHRITALPRPSAGLKLLTVEGNLIQIYDNLIVRALNRTKRPFPPTAILFLLPKCLTK